MSTAVTTQRPHGYARYKLDGCRCETCRGAVSAYGLARVHAVANGTWHPYVDSDPVRAHVKVLMAAGIGRRRLAELAGVSASMIRDLMLGKPGRAPSRRVRPEVASKILAVKATAAAVAAGANVDATGTHRRIQGLAVLGWTLTEQARRIGWTTQNYATVLDRDQVAKSTADKVTALYDQLSMRAAPAGYGATRVKRHALAKQWFAPLAWDDEQINDPSAAPVLLPPIAGSDPRADEWAIQHIMAGHRVGLDLVTRDELIRRLYAAGTPVVRIAEQLGISAQRVSQIALARRPGGGR